MQQERRMSTQQTQAVNIEQKKSYGIGGAGNIRLFPLSLSLFPPAFPYHVE